MSDIERILHHNKILLTVINQTQLGGFGDWEMITTSSSTILHTDEGQKDIELGAAEWEILIDYVAKIPVKADIDGTIRVMQKQESLGDADWQSYLDYQKQWEEVYRRLADS